MPEIELLAAGESDYRFHDLETLRAWMRDRKGRAPIDETAPAAGAPGRLDGNRASLRFSSFGRAPAVIERTATS